MPESHMVNIYLGLPDDPEEAFAVLHDLKYEDVINAESDPYGDVRHYRFKYVVSLKKFDEQHNLGVFLQLGDVPLGENSFNQYFMDFFHAASMKAEEYLIGAAMCSKSSTLAVITLKPEDKQAIHLLTQQIRIKLNELDINDDKRDNLHKKLSDFELEVDRDRTRTRAMADFSIGLIRSGATACKEAEPILDTIDRIFGVVDKAKKHGQKMLSYAEKKMLTAPEDQPTSLFDDDIPF